MAEGVGQMGLARCGGLLCVRAHTMSASHHHTPQQSVSRAFPCLGNATLLSRNPLTSCTLFLGRPRHP